MAINNFIPTIWSENLYHAMDKQFIGVAHCNREYEGEIKEKGSKVKVCGVGSVTISDYTKNTDMLSPQVLSDSYRDLEINRAKYFNFQIDDIDRAQCTPQLMEAAMKNAAIALANEADRYIFSLTPYAGLIIGGDNVNENNVIDYLLKARTALFKQNISDPNDIVIEVAPEIAEIILKAKAKLSTDNNEILENGCIGSIGGCKIYVSNNVYSEYDNDIKYYQCIARSRRAIAYADQISEVDAYRPELRFADAVKGLHLYGAKVFYPQEFILLNFGCGSSNNEDEDEE